MSVTPVDTAREMREDPRIPQPRSGSAKPKGCEMDGSAATIDEMVRDIVEAEVTMAPSRPQITKVRYSHQDMIDFILANPGCTQNLLAARYGYTPAWVSTVMSSDAFKAAFAARRAEVVDVELIATVKERFEGLTQRSLQRLAEELDKPGCKPEVMLKAAELGAKSMGIGGHAAPPAPPVDGLARLAERLIDLGRAHIPQPQGVLIDGEAHRV